MRNFARLCLAGVAAACSALLLSGCAQPGPGVTSQATSSVTPLFASDADALAAATKAYAAYLKMSDLIAQEGGANPERLAPLVTSEWLKKEVGAFNKFEVSGHNQTGNSTFRDVSLQQVSESLMTVTTYLCEDISGAHFLDGAGIDVTPSTRQDLVSLEVNFQNQGDNASELVVSEISPWSGTTVC